MRKIFIGVFCFFLSGVSYSQTGIGIFAGPQMTFFQPDNTTNYNQEYYKFHNPQLDYNLGVFGWLKLKNDWLLSISIGSNSKTYMLDNYYLPLPGVSWDEQYSQTISGTV